MKKFYGAFFDDTSRMASMKAAELQEGACFVITNQANPRSIFKVVTPFAEGRDKVKTCVVGMIDYNGSIIYFEHATSMDGSYVHVLNDDEVTAIENCER
jgi:hypothetical protein